jgi:anaerobic nitric oxide reductase transcription regulator
LLASGPLEQRLQRFVRAYAENTGADAVAVLHATGEGLVPLAFTGLVPEVLGRRFLLSAEPRLQNGVVSELPVRYPDDCAWPDPYDGLLERDPTATQRMHGCLVAPLRSPGGALGVLTLDSVDPAALDRVSDVDVGVLAALVGQTIAASLLESALSLSHREHEILALVPRIEPSGDVPTEFLGVSEEARRVRADISLVAATDLCVLISGETGTGKEVAARAIHLQSPRRGRPLVQINCAALPESIAEDELFGHVRGAFTGATTDRPGKFEAATGGTLFLDEVGELPLSIQPKLLRALQLGEIQRVGSDQVRKVDVRVTAATNRDLRAEVAAGRFRADLYHRLAVFTLELPPLRERPLDIDLYAGFFLDRARMRLGTGPIRLDSDARAALHSVTWGGNVRELEHVLLRAALGATRGVSRGGAVVVTEACLGLSQSERPALAVSVVPCNLPAGSKLSLRGATEKFQRDLIAASLSNCGGNWSAAARELQMDRANLRRLAQALGLSGQV